jgi:hypothetical protein
MPTGNTTLLGLALPVEGELDGTWGDVVNDSITALLDSAVAGTTTLSANTDVTLTTTALAANQARQAVILWTASNGATTRNITAPAQSKAYIVINAGTGSIVLRGAGPTTGVTIVSGEKCLAAWNGSDFVKVSFLSASSALGYTATVTEEGTTVLTNSSSEYQLFTGTTTQTITLPVTSTLQTGWLFYIANNSTGNLTVNSSGGNLVITVLPGTTAMCVCIGIASTNSDDWEAGFTNFNAVTGTGSAVLSNSPTFTSTPAAPTAAEKTATTQLATTAFVDRMRSLTSPATAATGGTAVTGDRGALLAQTSGSVTIPASVFAERDVFTIFNNSVTTQTITQGAGLTMYFAGTNTTGNRTLTQFGLATVVFISPTVAVISGGGLS